MTDQMRIDPVAVGFRQAEPDYLWLRPRKTKAGSDAEMYDSALTELGC